MNAYQGIPPDTYVNARLNTVFAAGIDEIADYISFSVSPFHSFQAVGVDIALPESESGFMGGCQYGKLASGSFCGFYPLVGI